MQLIKVGVVTFGLMLITLNLVSALTECETQRAKNEKIVKDQQQGQRGNVAVLVPKCDSDGNFAPLQCHQSTNFCQCWDKKGKPHTQPKKNLTKCNCMLKRAEQIESIPASQVGTAPVTSCETDGSFTKRQCNQSSCWCVNPETGSKIGKENTNKQSVSC